MTDSSLVTISIDELRNGMFVTKLDIPWLSSPFLTHSRLIKSSDDVEALVKCGVKELVIDINKGVQPKQCEVSAALVDIDEQPFELLVQATELDSPPISKVVPPVRKASFDQELQVAFVLRSKIKRSIEHIHDSLQVNKPVNAEELLPLVDSTLDSLARNDQALMSLVHLSRKAQRVADHAFGSFCLTLNLAVQLNVAPQQREQLGLAALLHEAGWVQLPLNLMGKRTPYTPAEDKLVHQHTLLAEQILKSSNLPALTLRIISEHHERLNGSGYPRCLQQYQIHYLTQILSVIDCYEERVHQLTDKPGMLPINAMRALYMDARKGLLNEQVVASFISMLGVYPATTAVLLNTGEKAIVLCSHTDTPLSPVIEIYYGREGKVLANPVRIDLNKQEGELKRSIEKAIDPSLPGVDPSKRLHLTEDHLN